MSSMMAGCLSTVNQLSGSAYSVAIRFVMLVILSASLMYICKGSLVGSHLFPVGGQSGSRHALFSSGLICNRLYFMTFIIDNWATLFC